jgi:hypothetical protein
MNHGKACAVSGMRLCGSVEPIVGSSVFDLRPTLAMKLKGSCSSEVLSGVPLPKQQRSVSVYSQSDS